MNLPLALDSVPSDGTGYVFAAYLFFLLVVVVYIGILGIKFQRINKELGQLNEELEALNAQARDLEQTIARNAAEILA